MFTASFNIEGLAALISGKDPVCGTEVDPTKAVNMSTHGGKAIYFCAPACKSKFDTDPEKYALQS